MTWEIVDKAVKENSTLNSTIDSVNDVHTMNSDGELCGRPRPMRVYRPDAELLDVDCVITGNSMSYV